MKNTPTQPETDLRSSDPASMPSPTAIRTGNRVRRNLLILGGCLILLGLLLGIRFVWDIVVSGTGWGMFLVVEGVILGFAAALIVIAFRLDPEAHGFSVLEEIKRLGKKDPADELSHHDLGEANVVELHLPAGNALYLAKDRSAWQYRRKGKMSLRLSARELSSFELVKNGLKFDPDTPDASGTDPLYDTFGVLLRFASPQKPFIELECRDKDTAILAVKELTWFQKG